MKPIEIVVEKTKNEFSPEILLLDCHEIVGIKKTFENEFICDVFLKNNVAYRAYGTYRTLSNRLFYALTKKTNIYDDIISRPSVLIMHKPENIECDEVFLDPAQMCAFIFSLEKNFDFDKIKDLESIKKINAVNFD